MNTIKKFLYMIIPAIAFLLVVCEIIITNELAGASGDISAVDREIIEIGDQNDLLSQEVASASALATISQKAALAGFVPLKKSSILALDGSVDVAVRLPEGSSVQ